MGFRPDAEFFEIVTHGREAPGMAFGRAAQEIRGFMLVAERNQIAKRLQPGQDLHRVPEIFGNVITKKLFEFESGAEEMIVVDEGVIHVRVRKAGWDVRLPDALGQPRAARPGLEMLFGVCSQTRDLLPTIFGRNRHQDRLVKAAADDFDLSRGSQRAKFVEIFRMHALQPFKQRARIVQADADRGMAFKYFDERQVGIPVCAFEHSVEIADRLVGVDQEDELEFLHREPQERVTE